MGYPQYLSHKQVGAAKISVVEFGADGSVVVYLIGFPKVVLSHEDRRNKPVPEAGNYLVQYADGYISFSPAKAFEEGYTPVIPNPAPAIDTQDGSGSEKYGASDWTAAKGQGVAYPGDDSPEELAALKAAETALEAAATALKEAEANHQDAHQS